MKKKLQRRDSAPTYRPEDLLTDIETAAYLKLQPHTLRVWRTSKRQPLLRYIRMGRTIRYQFGDILAFINALGEGTSSAAA